MLSYPGLQRSSFLSSLCRGVACPIPLQSFYSVAQWSNTSFDFVTSRSCWCFYSVAPRSIFCKPIAQSSNLSCSAAQRSVCFNSDAQRSEAPTEMLPSAILRRRPCEARACKPGPRGDPLTATADKSAPSAMMPWPRFQDKDRSASKGGPLCQIWSPSD